MKGKSRHKHKGSSLRIFSVYYFLLRFYYPEPPSSAGRNSWNSISYVAMLEPVSDPTRLAGQDGGLLVQTYQMAGEPEKARGYIQTREYLDLLNLVSDAMISLALYQDDFKRCQKTIYRIGNVIEQYRLEQLHPNVAAQFHYQTAVVYAKAPPFSFARVLTSCGFDTRSYSGSVRIFSRFLSGRDNRAAASSPLVRITV